MDQYRVVYTPQQADVSGNDSETLFAKSMSEPGSVVTFIDAQDDAVLQVVTSEVDRIEKIDGNGDVIETVFGRAKQQRSRAK